MGSSSVVVPGILGQDQPQVPFRRRSVAAACPKTCLSRRKVCSRSNRRRSACHSRPTSRTSAPVRDHHATPAWGRDRRAGDRRQAGLMSPSMRGSSPSCSSQAARLVSREATGPATGFQRHRVRPARTAPRPPARTARPPRAGKQPGSSPRKAASRSRARLTSKCGSTPSSSHAVLNATVTASSPGSVEGTRG